MASNFTTFTRQEFEAALAASVRRIVDAGNLEGVKIAPEKIKSRSSERVYYISTGHANVWIKIFSSIEPRSERSRDNGEDAVRFQLVDSTCCPDVAPANLLEKQPYMKRITTWRLNLDSRLERLFAEAHQLPMCQCGSVKVERTKRGTDQKFWGCAHWHTKHKPAGATMAGAR